MTQLSAFLNKLIYLKYIINLLYKRKFEYPNITHVGMWKVNQSNQKIIYNSIFIKNNSKANEYTGEKIENIILKKIVIIAK